MGLVKTYLGLNEMVWVLDTKTISFCRMYFLNFVKEFSTKYTLFMYI